MLANFLMTLPGGLDFCLANVFLECVCFFLFMPAFYQKCVYAFKG